MSETTELIAQQIINGNINKRTWGDILYNVRVYGAVGDGVKDDTAAIQATIDYALSVGGKAIFFPHGTYKVTALINSSSVVLFGDNATFVGGFEGTIAQIGAPEDLTRLALKADKTYVDTLTASIASGSPKGTYATLAALQAAFPTGNTNIYLVTADGNWYYWNVAAWTAGGVYQSTGITDASITPKKLSFLPIEGVQSKNIFNKATIMVDTYVSETNGQPLGIAGYFLSDYISIAPSTNGFLSGAVSGFRRIVFYDSSKAFLSFVDGRGTFTTPANTAFIRYASNIASDLNTSQIELGSVFTGYESYGAKVTLESLSRIQSITPITVQSIMSKIILSDTPKKIKLIGDSITAGFSGTGYAGDGETIVDTFKVNLSGHCWANSLKAYIQGKYTNVTVKNWGTSGVDSNYIVTKLSTLVAVDDDIVICMIGTNSRNTGNAISLLAYYNHLIQIGNYVKNAGKQIIFMSSIPASIANETDTSNPKSFHMEDVDHITMKASSDLEIEYISCFKMLVEYYKSRGLTLDSLLADGLHPNDAGYDVMFYLICNALGIGTKIEGATW